MKKYIFTLFLIPIGVFSQNDEFEKMRQEMANDFNSFRESVNKEYEDFKKVVWEEFETFRTGGFSKPKPKVVPVVTEPKPMVTPIPIVSPEKITIRPIKIVPQPSLPTDDFTEYRSDDFTNELLKIKERREDYLNVDFFGTSFNLFYDEFNFNIKGKPEDVALKAVEFFGKQKENIDDMIFQWANYTMLMELNDFGFLQTIRKSAKKIFQDKQKATFFTWYILAKTGFDCKIGFSEKQNLPILLVASNIPVLYTVAIHFGDKKYYAMLFDNADYQSVIEKSERIYTYNQNPFNGFENLDFTFRKVPKMTEFEGKSQKNDSYSNSKILLQYNANYVYFLSEMPPIDYPAYFSMPVSNQAKASLENILKPKLAGKTESQKVQILLSFVHSFFPYKFDSEHFGRAERPQAPEEILHNSYSDCEDNSALFAYLVNAFTNCEVMGVLYSDHATTAVRFKKERPNGYYLPAPYDDFLICDATFYGSYIGQSMPQYIGVMPETVFLVK